MVSDIDAVFETVGGDVAQRSFAVLKPGGRAAFIASGAQRAGLAARRRAVAAAAGRPRPAHLKRIVELVAAGAVRVPEINRFTLQQAQAAHRLSESRHVRGKLVFVVR